MKWMNCSNWSQDVMLVHWSEVEEWGDREDRRECEESMWSAWRGGAETILFFSLSVIRVWITSHGPPVYSLLHVVCLFSRRSSVLEDPESWMYTYRKAIKIIFFFRFFSIRQQRSVCALTFMNDWRKTALRPTESHTHIHEAESSTCRNTQVHTLFSLSFFHVTVSHPPCDNMCDCLCLDKRG